MDTRPFRRRMIVTIRVYTWVLVAALGLSAQDVCAQRHQGGQLQRSGSSHAQPSSSGHYQRSFSGQGSRSYSGQPQHSFSGQHQPSFSGRYAHSGSPWRSHSDSGRYRQHFRQGPPRFVAVPSYWPRPYYYGPAPLYIAPPLVAAIPAWSGDYWYYCPESRAYYPYVQECPSEWLRVVPGSAPPY